MAVLKAREFQLDVWSTKARLLSPKNPWEPGGVMSSQLSRCVGDGPSCLSPVGSAQFGPQRSWTSGWSLLWHCWHK